LALGVAGLLAASPALAASRVTLQFEYVVGFTCGSNDAGEERVVPGSYATAVNILNANDSDAWIRKHIALSFPPVAQEPGAVSDAIRELLDARHALQVDCGEIFSDEFQFADPVPETDHVQGFLVIESDRPLDISAVYTATGATGEVSVDVERVPERKIRRLADLDHRIGICHFPPGNPGNAHTLTIDGSAWPAHRSHGDQLGACNGS
jgi:hypothetical protein